MKVRLLLILAVGFLAAACVDHESYYGEFRSIDPDGWAYDSPVAFAPELRDSAVTGNLALSVRHTNRYPYSNIYVEVSVNDSVSSRRDTFNIVLADEFGRWFGRGIGTDFQLSDTLYRGLTLTSPAKISVRHVMRADLLPDIEQIGITFDADSKR